MRFKVAKRDLDEALLVVNSSLSTSDTDISGHYVFRQTGPNAEGKYSIEVLTYNMSRLFSACPMIVAVEEAGTDKTAFTVEGWRLKQWLQYVPEDSVPEFTLVDGEVTIQVKKGSQTFQSLDPSSYPFWDKALAAAEHKATVKASRLREALSYAKLFLTEKTPDNDPGRAVTECKAGVFYAMDGRGLTLIQVQGMENSGLRVHLKDIPGYVSFLGVTPEGDVDVLEHERNLFLRRCSDGAVFGGSRFQHACKPPASVTIDGKNHHTWGVAAAEIKSTVGFLVAGAEKKDVRLGISPGPNPNELLFSMATASGKTTSLVVPLLSNESLPKAPAIPDTGFHLDHTVLTKVLNAWEGDTVGIGINIAGARTFLRFQQEQGGDKFLTVIPCLRPT